MAYAACIHGLQDMQEHMHLRLPAGKDYLELKAFKKAADTVLGPDKYK